MATQANWLTSAWRYQTRRYAVVGAIGLLLSFCSRPGGGHPYETIVGASVAMAAWIALLPAYARLAVSAEDAINLRSGHVTPARLIRIAFHIPIILAPLAAAGMLGVRGNEASVSLLMLLLAAAGGLHAVATVAAYHGHGERVSNYTLSFSSTALLVAGVTLFAPLTYLAAALSLVFIWHCALGVLSDLRSQLWPRRGIGVFFGSFNPIHRTHLRILEDAISRRQLEKIYIHATTVPKLHRTAIENGEIAIAMRDGMREYTRTERADPGKNYFPTGNKFYEYSVRRELLSAAIRDAGLENRVEVLNVPHIYDIGGFFGVVRYIKALHPGIPIHGLHGSDPGGMWVRNIFDDSGWIYPCRSIRSDNVSATAIRNGAVGLTSPTVEKFLAASRAGRDFSFPSGYVSKNSQSSPI